MYIISKAGPFLYIAIFAMLAHWHPALAILLCISTSFAWCVVAWKILHNSKKTMPNNVLVLPPVEQELPEINNISISMSELSTHFSNK